MSIYVMSHKETRHAFSDEYKVLMLGSYRGHISGKNILYDDEGENISRKNDSYCELTGVYWLWKNVRDRYIGIVHYRRFFTHSFWGRNLVREKEILRILKNYDIIVPFERTLKCSVREQYCVSSGYAGDLDIVREVIRENCPEYLGAYDYVFLGNKVYFSNMMITSIQLFDDYSEWLFTILEQVEKRVDCTHYNEYQKRIFGFISERLLKVYIEHNHLKVFEMGVINTEEKYSAIKRFLIMGKRVLLFAWNGGYR